jgi:dTDP-glucose 4,6-dehydratase
MKLLVCGGAGFIGSNFVRQRVNDHGDEVVVLDALTYAGRPENLDDLGVTLVHGEIQDAEKVAEALGDGVDAIVNFAAESHVDRSISGPQAFVDTNVRGTMTLLEGARERDVARYVQISTDEVYGSIEEGSFTEESPIVPSSPYSASKAGGDLLVQSYFHTYGLETVIARGSNNYGPRQYPEKLIPLMMLSALHDDNLLVYGDGLNVRNWLFVEDFGRGISHILAHGAAGEVYNVGGPSESTNLDVVQGILTHAGKDESLIKFIEDRQGHDRRYSLGSEKVRKLGWSAQVDFEEGLERTLSWYRDTASWWQPIIDSAEFREYYERHYKRPLAWGTATPR